MFWFVCFVLKYILPFLLDQRKTCKKSTPYFFLPLCEKKDNFSRPDRHQEGINIVIELQSPDCRSQAHQSLFYLAFQYNKSLAPPLDLQGHDSNQRVLPCPDLRYHWHIMNPTQILTGVAEYVHWHLKLHVQAIHILSSIQTWSNSQVFSVNTCASSLFFPPTMFVLHGFNSKYLLSFLIGIKRDNEKIIWCFYSRDDKI